MHKCDICGKIFKQKCHLSDHKKRKKPCNSFVLNNTKIICSCAQNEVCNNTSKYNTQTNYNCCPYCQKIFSQKSALNRHFKNNCKIKQQKETEKEDIFKQLLREIQEIKEKNKQLEQALEKINNRKIEKTINNKTQNNLINGNIVSGNTIMLVGCGKEDIGKIDKNEIIRAVKAGYHTPIKLTDTVHFNPKYPEYHNVYISNMKDKYGMIYDGEKWNLATKNDLVDKLYDNNKSYVEENLDEFCSSLHPSQRNALDRWLNTDDDTPKIKDVKDRIKLLLYNKREMAIQIKDRGDTTNRNIGN